MRIMLLLHPEYTFPHQIESFPTDTYCYQWLDQTNESKLIIIGNCQLQLPSHYEERIIFYPVSYNHTDSFLSWFQYRWVVMRGIKKYFVDRILFDGLDTFNYYKKHPFLSLSNSIINKHFSIIHHSCFKPYPTSLAKHVIPMSELPSPAYTKKDENLHDQIKKKLTDGAEYFLCSANFTSTDQITILLKAYSLFKQRFKTNFKLVLSGLYQHDKRYISMLNNYKYRHDVIIPSSWQNISFSSVLSASYAHIFPSSEVHYPCSYADCAGSQVPFIYSEGLQNVSDIAAGFNFAVNNVQDLADKMMQIYKDETGRMKMVQNMNEYFKQQDMGFDISAYLQ